MGTYVIEPYSTPQGGLPAVTVLSMASVAGGKWNFAQAFGAITGGCTYVSSKGVADWRQPASTTPGAPVALTVSLSGTATPAP
jgi:hypothetical protein